MNLIRLTMVFAVLIASTGCTINNNRYGSRISSHHKSHYPRWIRYGVIQPRSKHYRFTPPNVCKLRLGIAPHSVIHMFGEPDQKGLDEHGRLELRYNFDNGDVNWFVFVNDGSYLIEYGLDRVYKNFVPNEGARY